MCAARRHQHAVGGRSGVGAPGSVLECGDDGADRRAEEDRQDDGHADHAERIGHQKKSEDHKYDATDTTMQRLKTPYATQTNDPFASRSVRRPPSRLLPFGRDSRRPFIGRTAHDRRHERTFAGVSGLVPSWRCNDGAVDWNGLIVVAFAAVFGWVSWRWSVPYNVSCYKMLWGREPDKASWMFKGFQFSRWAGMTFSGFLIGIVVLGWITS